MLTAREREQLDGVVALLRDVFAGDLIGACLHGSAVSGALRPASDLDVLAVVARASVPDEKARLISGLLGLSRARGGHGSTPGSRPLEVTIVVQSVVCPWRSPESERFDFQFGNWLRDEFEAGNFAPWPEHNPDVAVLLTAAIRSGRALVGPPPAQLLDPVPRPLLERTMVAGLDDLMADLAWDTGNVLLTLARIWITLATGDIHAKDAAAAWAAERLGGDPDAPSVLERARASYRGEVEDRWDGLESAVTRTANRLVAAIRSHSSA